MGGYEGGWLRGIGDGMTSHHMLTHAPKESRNHTNLAYFGVVGCWAGCVLSSKSIERIEFAFGKLLGELEP